VLKNLEESLAYLKVPRWMLLITKEVHLKEDHSIGLSIEKAELNDTITT
jgi:hypothetical protein